MLPKQFRNEETTGALKMFLKKDIDLVQTDVLNKVMDYL
jgi:hypothetical protein